MPTGTATFLDADPEGAVRLLGTASGARTALSLGLPPYELRRHDQTLAAARLQLGVETTERSSTTARRCRWRRAVR